MIRVESKNGNKYKQLFVFYDVPVLVFGGWPFAFLVLCPILIWTMLYSEVNCHGGKFI